MANYYSVTTIASVCNVSEKTIRRIIKTLDIDVQYKQGNTKLYSEESLCKIQTQLAKNQLNQGVNADSGKCAVKEVVNANLTTSKQVSVPDVEMITRIVAMTVKTTIEQLIPVISGLNRVQSTNITIEAPKVDSRAHVTQLVRNYARAVKMPYQDVYSLLYTEFGYRTHTNPSKCAMNREQKIIDYIDQSGNMPVLEAVAKEILIPPKKYEKDWLAE